MLTGRHKMDVTDANIDLEKAAGNLGQSPCSPNSQSTWESQNPTLNIPIVEEQIIIEEDTDEESGKFRTTSLKITALNNLTNSAAAGASTSRRQILKSYNSKVSQQSLVSALSNYYSEV